MTIEEAIAAYRAAWDHFSVTDKALAAAQKALQEASTAKMRASDEVGKTADRLLALAVDEPTESVQ